jgi:hypothetical protein
VGASSVKWLQKISVLDRPFEGFFMDKVYRTFQKGKDPETGTVVTTLPLKSIITLPLNGEKFPAGPLTILGAAYAGEAAVTQVEVSLDNAKTWAPAEFFGLNEPFAWRQWQYVWEAKKKGEYTIMARATDSEGHRQPMNATWNVLGYYNNGIQEHAVRVTII